MESRCEDFEAQFEESPIDLRKLDRLIIREDGWQYAIASDEAKEIYNKQRQKANHIVLVEMLDD